MDNRREKLVDLIIDAKSTDPETGSFTEHLADHLIANGVTFAEDSNVPAKWISVEERLPEPFVSVLAYVPSESPFPLVHESYLVNETLWVCILERRPWKDGAVTHWMPMPEPPVE